MRNFAELARIVTTTGIKKHDTLFDDSSANGKKYLNLANALTDNPDLSDDEAEKITGLKKSSSSFRMFRSRFKEKLLNSILSSDLGANSNLSRVELYLSKTAVLIKMLTWTGARFTASDLLIQMLKKATDYELYEFACYCTQLLKAHQRQISNPSKYTFYKKLYYDYEEKYKAEMLSAELYDEIILNHTDNNIFPDNDLKIETHKLEQLIILKEKYNTYKINLNYFRSAGNLAFIQQDYISSFAYWDQAIEYIIEYKHFEYNVRLAEFTIQKMNLCLYIHDFDLGFECAAKCKLLYPSGTRNWFLYQELYFLLSIQTKNYIQANEIIKDVISSNQLRFQVQPLQERLKLFEAYCFILSKAGIIKQSINSKFRFSTFLNSITIHSKDKKGYNASILIAEMMYHILNKEFHVVTEKMDALKRYSKRHFEDSDNYRSDIFIRILIECEKNKFEKVPVLQKTKKMVAKLQETQFSYISSLDGIEIVPFIDLWKIVLNCLD